MIKGCNVIMGQYISRNSVIHMLDPRTKIILVFLNMLLILIAGNIVAYGILIVLSSAIIKISKIPVIYFMRSLRPILVILSFSFVYQVFHIKGMEEMIHIGKLIIYKEGVISAFVLCGKIILLIVIASLLTLTTKPLDIARGFEKILSPLKKLHVPVAGLSLMISIMLRFIPVLLDEFEKIKESQIARGADFTQKNPMKRMMGYKSIIIPLLLSAVNKADNLTLSIEARGFGDGSARTCFHEQKYEKSDYIAFFSVIGTFLLILLVNIRYQI